jgi:transcriptional regulatory protein RtcR
MTMKQKEPAKFLKMGIDTANREYNRLMEGLADTVLNRRGPVLLLGGTGTGKTTLARRIYELKKQQGLVQGPLIEADCDVLHGDEAVSALFGEGRGGKADAGALAAAAGGMLLLDDTDRLEADVQKLLLKALEAGWFTRRGLGKKTVIDFELISTAEGNLQEGISLGLIREDFLSQIGLWTFTLPALKDRPEDILHNIMFLLWDYEKQ